MRKRIIILVSGIVQGVFFRSSTQKKARKLSLTGFVKNEPDGKVKIVAEGEEKSLEELIKWAKRGPMLAKVNGIEVKWDKAQGEFEDFKIMY